MKSFLRGIRTWWKLRRAVKGARSAYIVAGGDLNQELRARRRMAPREQLALLDRISRFARRENIKLFVVFESRPLRKVPHGAEYRQIGVFYSEGRNRLADTIVGLFQRLRRSTDVTVVTSDDQLEARIRRSGGKIMRSSTFRKALEAAGGRDTARSRRSGRRRRGQTKSTPRPAGEGGKEPQAGDTIESMIDVVR